MGTGVGASRRPLTTPPQQDLPQCCLSLLTTWWPTPPGQAGESLSAFYDLLRGLRPLLLVFLLIRHESSLVHALREENCCSVTKSCPTLCNPMDCSLPGSLVLHYLPEFAQIHVCWVDNGIQSSHPVLPHLLLPSVFSSIKVFHNESALHIRWPKYWSFSISPSNEYSGLISFSIDWFNLLAVQGTLKSLLQHHCTKASILRYSTFFMVQLSHPYITIGKTIVLTRQTFVHKVRSQLFNMLSRLVITFLPRSKRLLISWLQSPSVVIMEPKKIVYHCFLFSPIYLPWSDGTGCHNLSFLNAEF